MVLNKVDVYKIDLTFLRCVATTPNYSFADTNSLARYRIIDWIHIYQ